MPLTVKKSLQIALAGLVFLCLAIVSAFITMKAVTWSRTVAVPDVRDMNLPAAINLIRNAVLNIKVEREEHHPTVPQNYIIGQNPAPGDRVKGGRDVLVVVSLGSQEVTVPQVAGEVFRLAQVGLRQAGLNLGELARVNSPSPVDTVILQSPPKGTVVQKDSAVDILASAGARLTRYVTPDLRGMTLPQAGAAMRPMGGKVLYSGKGSVIASQNPRAGFRLPENGQIIVALGASALGKAPEPEPEPGPGTGTGTGKTPASAAQGKAPAQPAPKKPEAGNQASGAAGRKAGAAGNKAGAAKQGF